MMSSSASASASASPFDLDRILTASCSTDPDDLHAVLVSVEALLRDDGGPKAEAPGPSPRSARRARVRLLVVDSMAALYRGADASKLGDQLARCEALFAAAALLKGYAARYGVAVLLTNHVVAAFKGLGSAGRDPGDQGGDQGGVMRLSQVGNVRELASSEGPVVPALGFAWSSCVNTRLFVARRAQPGAEGPGAGLRRMQVLLAPHLPPAECDYVIERGGVRGVASSSAAASSRPAAVASRDLG